MKKEHSSKANNCFRGDALWFLVGNTALQCFLLKQFLISFEEKKTRQAQQITPLL